MRQTSRQVGWLAEVGMREGGGVRQVGIQAGSRQQVGRVAERPMQA